MRGKKAKQLRVDRTAEREAARRKQRQQTLFTVIVIAIIVGIGGVLVYVSLNEAGRDLADAPTEGPTGGPTEASTGGPDDRPVACGAERPAEADEEKATYTEPEQVLEDGVDYQTVISTSCGRIRVDLDEERAPQTVNSFVFLAQEGFFDGLEIFRNATSIGALQTGAGTNEASFDIGYTLEDELETAEEEGYEPGTLAMANAGPGTAGSQFFFVYNDQFQLEPDYTVFGMTNRRGIRVLETIGAIPVENPEAQPGDPAGERPSEITYIESVEILTE